MFLQPPECLKQPRQPVKNYVRKNILHGLKDKPSLSLSPGP